MDKRPNQSTLSGRQLLVHTSNVLVELQRRLRQIRAISGAAIVSESSDEAELEGLHAAIFDISGAMEKEIKQLSATVNAANDIERDGGQS